MTSKTLPTAPTNAPSHPAHAPLRAMLLSALPTALRRLDPRHMAHQPVLFLVEVGSVGSAILSIAHPSVLAWSITVWLWLTIIFANLAEAVAEGRGKAQAATLREARTETSARVLVDGKERQVPSSQLHKGDVVLVRAGKVIPGDGDVIEGAASVDESAITGESAPVIRESGGDRSAVTGGTTVLSDEITVRITQEPGSSFLDTMISLVEGASRHKTPNELALSILLSALSIIFLLAVVSLQPFAIYSGTPVEIIVLLALLVCLIPTTIGGLLSAIGIAGMDRLVQHNVLAMSGRAVEAAGDVTTLLLDKTGTITYGNRRATGIRPAPGTDPDLLAYYCLVASLADSTPEGRSIVDYIEGLNAELACHARTVAEGAQPVPFSAETRMSGADLSDGIQVRKGAAQACQAWIGAAAGPGASSSFVDAAVAEIAQHGATPLVVAIGEPNQSRRILGVIELEDVVKDGMRERFDNLRAMGIRTVMVTGDNPVTARSIARKAGVDDVLAEAKPEDKVALIRREQAGGALVAMCGDGTNDAPALAQADVGVAMNTGTSAAKEAGNMVDLDSDPTKLIEIVGIGKQLLMTRGALTTFSIANDVAKYFAIVPAMFMLAFPQLGALNIMGLHSPHSAILSAVIFNALIIVALVPLALRGVAYRARPAADLLRRNLFIYGLGGIIAPFIGIKLIDLIVTCIPGLG